MREIKYNTWNPESKEMASLEEMAIRLADVPQDSHEDDPHIHPWVTIQSWMEQGLILLEASGVYDNTGRELYEGDVVQAEYDVLVIAREAENNSLTAALLWEDGEIDPANGDFLQNINNKCIYLGNIYQNPELKSRGEK